MTSFVLLGCAGYVAPKHLKAIRDVGGNLVAALDPHDSVGVVDQYFPECAFFTEFERFDRYCDKLIRSGTPIDYVSIATPNYLHDPHCRFALRIGANAICEKPLVLREKNLDNLQKLESETGKKISCILQLRLNKILLRLKETTSRPGLMHSVDLVYQTPRGQWYLHSWKGNAEKSGGLATNIGVHLFDLIQWLFGDVQEDGLELTVKNDRNVSGYVLLQNAAVSFNLSIEQGEPCRKIVIDGHEIEFSQGFTDLHTESYREILAGRGFGIEDSRPSIRLCEQIRNYSI